MIKAMIIIILSPVVMICGILSIAIIYAILNRITEIVMMCVKTINDFINNRDDNKC